MYNIFELKAKTLPELKEIAAQLGIAVGNNIDTDDLVYTILDEQAITASKTSQGEGKKRKKKTRTGKTEKENEDTTDEQPSMPLEVPTTEVAADELAADARLISWMTKVGMTKSNGEARKAIQQGGVSVNDEKISAPDFKFTAEMLAEGVIVKKGKKTFHKMILG